MGNIRSKRIPTRLRGLAIKRVSLCNDGANPGARVVLYKWGEAGPDGQGRGGDTAGGDFTVEASSLGVGDTCPGCKSHALDAQDLAQGRCSVCGQDLAPGRQLTPGALIDQTVKRLITKAANGMSYEQALTALMRENPGAWAQHVASMNARGVDD